LAVHTEIDGARILGFTELDNNWKIPDIPDPAEGSIPVYVTDSL